MKQIRILGVCVLVISAILMSSCKKSALAKDVVGTYQVSDTEEMQETAEEPGMLVSMNYVQEFKTDDRFVLGGTLKMVIVMGDSLYSNVLGFEYAIDAKGSWEVKGDTLYQRIRPEDVNIALVEAVASEEDEVSSYVLGTLQESIDVYIPQMKEALNSSARIMKVDSTEMVLQSADNTQLVYKRLK